MAVSTFSNYCPLRFTSSNTSIHIMWLLVTVVRCDLGLRMEKTACRYTGQQRIYWINSSEQLTMGCSSRLGIGRRASNSLP